MKSGRCGPGARAASLLSKEERVSQSASPKSILPNLAKKSMQKMPNILLIASMLHVYSTFLPYFHAIITIQ